MVIAIFGMLSAKTYEKSHRKACTYPIYVSPKQLTLECFKTSFEKTNMTPKPFTARRINQQDNC